MDENSTPQQHSTIPSMLLHAGLMSGAEYTHQPIEAQRLMREQRERDAYTLEQHKSLYVLGLR